MFAPLGSVNAATTETLELAIVFAGRDTAQLLPVNVAGHELLPILTVTAEPLGPSNVPCSVGPLVVVHHVLASTMKSDGSIVSAPATHSWVERSQAMFAPQSAAFMQ